MVNAKQNVSMGFWVGLGLVGAFILVSLALAMLAKAAK